MNKDAFKNMLQKAEKKNVLDPTVYKKASDDLRVKMLSLQQELSAVNFPTIILICGIRKAGKGTLLKGLNKWMDPRFLHAAGFGVRNRKDAQLPSMARFWQSLPRHGEIAIFTGGWYQEPIEKYQTKQINKKTFYTEIERGRQFETMLCDDGALIIKIFLHLGEKQQKQRLKQSLSINTVTSKFEKRNMVTYATESHVAKKMLYHSHMDAFPWFTINGWDSKNVLVEIAQHILQSAKKHQKQKKTNTTSKTISTPLKINLSYLDNVDLTQQLKKTAYLKQQQKLHAEFLDCFHEMHRKKKSLIVVMEGWDAGGKGGAIRSLLEPIDPRWYKIIPVSAPQEKEKQYHYLWRFWNKFTKTGRITVFDRSWYGRVMVERIEKFATETEWQRAYDEINAFEQQLVEDNILLVKFFLHIDKAEQATRFQKRKNTAHKRYKLTAEDLRNRSKWREYTHAMEEVVTRTNISKKRPWHLIAGNDKRFARIAVLETVCKHLRKNL